jgi:hypothetical protein
MFTPVSRGSQPIDLLLQRLRLSSSKSLLSLVEAKEKIAGFEKAHSIAEFHPIL